jgi:hypothetical protein
MNPDIFTFIFQEQLECMHTGRRLKALLLRKQLCKLTRRVEVQNSGCERHGRKRLRTLGPSVCTPAPSPRAGDLNPIGVSPL